MTTPPDERRAPKPPLSEIGRLDDVCPSCDEPLPVRPMRKSGCPHCGVPIFVRLRPFDRQRVLLTDLQTAQVESEWTMLQAWEKRSGRPRKPTG